MKKILISFSVGLALLSTTIPASAATLTTNQIQAVISLLQAFGVSTTTIANVQQALNGAETSTGNTSTTATTTATTLTPNAIGFLHMGDNGRRVRLLQMILAADPSIYPQGIISGFFGKLTSDALKRYQKKHGLDQVGFVGPETLQFLGRNMEANPIAVENGGENASSTISAGEGHTSFFCAIVPPGHLIAPGWLRHHGGERPVIPTCQTLPPGIENQINSATTTQSTTNITAPTISGISINGITASTTSIDWITDEPATSYVDYGTTSSYGDTVTNGTILSTSHDIELSGLTASTLYHFRITSTDAANNTATTSDETFTTSVASDTIPPVISLISVGSIASTSADVSWTTNEPATSEVYFSTSSPLDLTTAMTTIGSGLLMTHSLTISPLTASTTYYYVVSSQDALNNIATTSENSFTTLSQ